MNELLSKVYFTQLWEDLSNARIFKSWDEIQLSDQLLFILIVSILGLTFFGLVFRILIRDYKASKHQKLMKITADFCAKENIKIEEHEKHEKRKAQEKLNSNSSDIQILNLENMERVRSHLDGKLTFVFDQFIITRLLFIFKQFGSVSIENAQKTKQEFIDRFEASLTEFEKEQFKKIFDNFPAFKLYVVQFYNIKLVKLELLITHKVELEETEFKDYKLINSLCNDLTKKDLKNILDILQ